MLDISLQDSVIIWHDEMNNSATDHQSDPRPKLTPIELLDESRLLPQKIGVVYCQLKVAENVLKNLGDLEIPVVERTSDIIFRKKQ